jgi:hypothetical protein
MKPGVTILPVASMTSGAPPKSAPSSTILPLRTVPFLMIRS